MTRNPNNPYGINKTKTKHTCQSVSPASLSSIGITLHRKACVSLLALALDMDMDASDTLFDVDIDTGESSGC